MGKTIQWFPGHMAKAKKQMVEALKQVDVVIEIRDARIPLASKNPLLDEIAQKKPRLILLSKKDKADSAITEQWLQALRTTEAEVEALDFLKDPVLKVCVQDCQKLAAAKRAKDQARGIQPRAIRALVCGIPNVGKSTLINSIAKRHVASTGNKPGVTKSLQWIRLDQDLQLLDTPGVLWPKFEDHEVGLLLALTGAINDTILDLREIALFGMERMQEYYPERLVERYGISLQEDSYANLLAIGEKKGLIKAKGLVDEERTSRFFLTEIREDKCGSMTWERPCVHPR